MIEINKYGLTLLFIVASLISCSNKIEQDQPIDHNGIEMTHETFIDIPNEDAVEYVNYLLPMPQSVDCSGKLFYRSGHYEISYEQEGGFEDEAYELRIEDNGITIRYSSEAGRFYAEKTLEQLSSAGTMYCAVIKDAPRYQWRGFLLDEARHFFGKEKVKQYLDMMARYKLNRFHWHLTDDYWRIEIDAYPQLCEIGAIGSFTNASAPARYYTKEDIREILAYAAERHIEVVPEIDFPGHSKALTKAIPEISGGNNTVNPGSEKTYEVIEQIFKEVAELFPGRYIHIGGDEVNNTKWQELEEVKALMAKEGYTDIKQVQAYFGRRVCNIITKCGKKIVAWDDLLDSGTSPEGKILQWYTTKRPTYLPDGLAAGFNMIICPGNPFYLDYKQSASDKIGHAGGVQAHTLDQIYNYEVEENALVLGVQANLWTEHIMYEDRLDYMAFPRLIALAELAWTKTENMNYDNFLMRLDKEYRYLDKMGIYYYDVRNQDNHPEPPYKI